MLLSNHILKKLMQTTVHNFMLYDRMLITPFVQVVIIFQDVEDFVQLLLYFSMCKTLSNLLLYFSM